MLAQDFKWSGFAKKGQNSESQLYQFLNDIKSRSLVILVSNNSNFIQDTRNSLISTLFDFHSRQLKRVYLWDIQARLISKNWIFFE